MIIPIINNPSSELRYKLQCRFMLLNDETNQYRMETILIKIRVLKTLPQ